jgi:hypothetical protein
VTKADGESSASCTSLPPSLPPASLSAIRRRHSHHPSAKLGSSTSILIKVAGDPQVPRRLVFLSLSALLTI